MPDIEANTHLEQAELDAAKRLGAFRDHPVARLLGPVSKAADQPPMLGIAAAALVVGLFGGLPRVERAGAQALASVALATAVKHLVKHTVTRSRPHKLIDEGEYRRETGASEDKGEQSFPSGHTADAVAAARAVARVYPGLAIPAGGFAVLAGAAQPLRAAHYLSDVAAGAAIGWAAEHFVEQARRWFASRFAPG